MSDDKKKTGRRKVLKLLGSGATAVATAPRVSAARTRRGVVADTLRGSSRSPVSIGDIKRLRRQFAEDHGPGKGGKPSGAFVDLKRTVADSRIIGYNIVGDGETTPREQFTTRDGVAKNPTGSRKTRKDRLHEKADEMLEDAKEQVGAAPSLSISSTEADWSDWYSYGSTDLYHEFPRMGAYDTRPGNVKFENEVRKYPGEPRAGARSKLRIEPGRQVCNDGFDAYCTPTVQDGYQNKSATVFHDWDKSVNATPTDELITGTDPEGQISDVTTSRTVSLSLEASGSGFAGSVGYSSSVTLPGAELVDATTLAAGESEHQFTVNSTASNASTNNAIFEIGSAARWDPDCADDGRATQRSMMDIDVDLQWGLDVPLSTWGDVISTSKSFGYVTYC